MVEYPTGTSKIFIKFAVLFSISILARGFWAIISDESKQVIISTMRKNQQN